MANADRKIGFWGYALRLASWLVIFSLLISYMAQWISPAKFWPIAFFGLAYPVLFILNFILLVHWIFRKRRFLIYPLVTLMLGLPIFGRFYQMGNSTEVVDISSPFKILTYNVHVFDKYHSKYGGDYARDGIVDFLMEQSADVYCFQEFYTNENKADLDHIKLLQEKLKTPYYYAAKYTPKTKSLYNIILSKYPITNKGNIGKTGNDQELSGVFADIKIGSRKIRVYSVHLRSFQISSETAMFNLDYDLASDQGQEAVKNNSIKMVKKFKHAFDKRALQIEELKSHIASSELPVIVAGDFNDTPSSFSYGQLTKTLDDSFKENGSGFGTTYIGPYPPFRIDYILHDPHFTNYAFDTWPVKFSDHYPISALFSMDDVNE